VPAFRYRALTVEGRLVKGVLEGDSERQVRTQLRAQQLKPVDVAATRRESAASRRPLLLRPRISGADLSLVTRQLATLVQSALPVAECLTAVAQQTRRPRNKAILLQLRSRVAEGHTLAYAMGEFPQSFNEMYRAMVRAGEHAGFLGPVLEQLADYLERRQHTAQSVQMAMIYPFILLGVAVAVVTALMVFVVPELIGIFAHSNAVLPPLTRVLIGTSDFLRNWGGMLLLSLVVALIAARVLLQAPARRRRWHAFLLRVPFFGGLLIARDSARFASTLSILMASGVPLLEALRIAGEVLSNRILREDCADVAERVQAGGSLSRALGEHGRFPPMLVHMVASGESSGELEAMLKRSAQNQERELEVTLGTFLGVLEPLMVVLMGGVVLLIVLAILLPIFNLNTMVR